MNFKIEKYRVPQPCESREIFGETETMKMAPRQDQSRGLESRLQAFVETVFESKYVLPLHCTILSKAPEITWSLEVDSFNFRYFQVYL